jgi:RHS repeat-associated protein
MYNTDVLYHFWVLSESDYYNNRSEKYIYKLDGIIAKYKESTGYYRFYKDHLGSTRQLGSTTTSSYSSRQRRDYYPYGELTYSAGDETGYTYTGKEHHTNIGLTYFGRRYYDPSLGRWLTPDPAGQFFSPYVYCANNPMMYIDKDGQFASILPFFFGWMGHRTAQGLEVGNPVGGFMQGAREGMLAFATVGTGGAASSATGSLLAGSLAASAFSSTTNYVWSGGKSDYTLSAGPFTHNFTTGEFSIANPYDEDFRTLKGWGNYLLESMAWGSFLSDNQLRNIPGTEYGLKWARFANDLPNTIFGLLDSYVAGEKFSHFDLNNLVIYFENKKSSGAWGHVVSTGIGVIDCIKSGCTKPYMIQTISHELDHVLVSGSLGGIYTPLYFSMEGIGYFSHFLFHGNFNRLFGWPDYNLFEISAYYHAEQISGLRYSILPNNFWWR